jgi:hypothetical protein
MKARCFVLFFIFLVLTSSYPVVAAITFVEKKDRVDVFIDGNYITSYLFGGFKYNKIEGNTGIGGYDNGFVAKPVLYPAFRYYHHQRIPA